MGPKVSKRKESRKQHLEGPRLVLTSMGHHRTQSCSEAYRLLGNSNHLGQKGESSFGVEEEMEARMRVRGSISILLFLKKKKEK